MSHEEFSKCFNAFGIDEMITCCGVPARAVGDQVVKSTFSPNILSKILQAAWIFTTSGRYKNVEREKLPACNDLTHSHASIMSENLEAFGGAPVLSLIPLDAGKFQLLDFS